MGRLGRQWWGWSVVVVVLVSECHGKTLNTDNPSFSLTEDNSTPPSDNTSDPVNTDILNSESIGEEDGIEDHTLAKPNAEEGTWSNENVVDEEKHNSNTLANITTNREAIHEVNNTGNSNYTTPTNQATDEKILKDESSNYHTLAIRNADTKLWKNTSINNEDTANDITLTNLTGDREARQDTIPLAAGVLKEEVARNLTEEVKKVLEEGFPCPCSSDHCHGTARGEETISFSSTCFLPLNEEEDSSSDEPQDNQSTNGDSTNTSSSVVEETPGEHTEDDGHSHTEAVGENDEGQEETGGSDSVEGDDGQEETGGSNSVESSTEHAMNVSLEVMTSPYCQLSSQHSLCLYHPDHPASACGTAVSMGVSSSEQAEVVAIHNELRATVARGAETRGSPGPQPPAADMMMLEWDDELANVAQAWVNQCVFQHDCGGCRRLERWSVGQNLYLSTGFSGTGAEWRKALTGFYDEVAMMTPKQVKAFSGAGGVGHYTQLVWGDTRYVGCGFIQYKTSGSHTQFYYACNYGKAGNFLGRPIYQQGSSCSRCPSGTSCSTTHPALCGAPGGGQPGGGQPGGGQPWGGQPGGGQPGGGQPGGGLPGGGQPGGGQSGGGQPGGGGPVPPSDSCPKYQHCQEAYHAPASKGGIFTVLHCP